MKSVIKTISSSFLASLPFLLLIHLSPNHSMALTTPIHLHHSEFVLKSNIAFWWLANGQKLAFASFDNSQVNQMPVVVYGSAPSSFGENISRDTYISSTEESHHQVYPKVTNYPYPKPGRPNPVVSVWVSDFTSPIARTSKQVTPPKEMFAQ